MKRLCAAVIFSVSFSLSFFSPFTASAEPPSTPPAVLTYAQIKNELTLYSDALLQMPVTTLPPTYFVIVLENNINNMRISYHDLTGYINPAGVEITDYEPVTKFATVFRFSVNNDGYPATLRQNPDHQTSNRLAEIPNGAKGMYYGAATGSTIIPEVGNLWYYVKYETQSGVARGYVYKSQVYVDPIEPNRIEKVIPKIEDPSPKNPLEPGDTMSILIILSLSLPAVLITLLIFGKKGKANRNPRFRKDK